MKQLKNKLIDWFTIEDPIDLNNFVIGIYHKHPKRARHIAWSKIASILCSILILTWLYIIFFK